MGVSELLGQAAELRDHELLGEIARGGQGAVFRARHRRTGAQVAVKLLLEERSPDADRARLRFVREGRLLRELVHPHLPRVLAVGSCPAGPFLVMELVEGPHLGRIVAEGGPPPPAWSARTVAVVARALHACHQRGIVHRDVKPANVLVERHAGRVDPARGGELVLERPVLVDFGLARREVRPGQVSPWTAWEPLTATGQFVGTPAFSSPEQAGLGEVGPPSDVYALGAVLYFLLTGQAPFQGESSWNVLVAVLRGALTPPRALRPDLPEVLDLLCRRTLALEAGERPGALELAEALDDFVDPRRSAG